MKIPALALSALALTLATSYLRAQGFDSGSTGAYGPMNITVDTTLTPPSDGIFHCTTINVASGKTLKFERNALNTPIYLLATGNVTISGTINLDGSAGISDPTLGRGGPGGFDGGYAGFAGQAGGSGFGPGGGRPGGTSIATSTWSAAFALAAQGNTNTYGNSALMPLIGGSGGTGSGGNPGYFGGGGGGAILIASNTTITCNGAIRAIGGAGVYNGSYWGTTNYSGSGAGSGGAVRLISPVISGSGAINVQGNSVNNNVLASAGRIRIDCPDRYSFRSLTLQGRFSSGALMQTFSTGAPTLSFIEAAGQSITEGTVAAVQVDLPAGSSPNRNVKLRARNFTGIVPIRVVVTPETGASTTYDSQIDMAGNNAAEATVDVVIPTGTVSRIHAWTR